jgi:hypothetical protein
MTAITACFVGINISKTTLDLTLLTRVQSCNSATYHQPKLQSTNTPCRTNQSWPHNLDEGASMRS